MIDAERVDFIGVPVQDLRRADEFYGTTLGLERSPHSGPRWVEYETGNVTIALISPEAMGPDFQPQPHSMPIALRVADVEQAKRKLQAAGVEFDDESRSDTYPYMKIDENEVDIGHEATVSKIGEEQLFYLMSRGLSEPEASALIVSGFVEPITKELPLEYAVEMNRLIQLQMEGSVG